MTRIAIASWEDTLAMLDGFAVDESLSAKNQLAQWVGLVVAASPRETQLAIIRLLREGAELEIARLKEEAAKL
jgi:hypothetical protein